MHHFPSVDPSYFPRYTYSISIHPGTIQVQAFISVEPVLSKEHALPSIAISVVDGAILVNVRITSFCVLPPEVDGLATLMRNSRSWILGTLLPGVHAFDDSNKNFHFEFRTSTSCGSWCVTISLGHARRIGRTRGTAYWLTSSCGTELLCDWSICLFSPIPTHMPNFPAFVEHMECKSTNAYPWAMV